MSVLPTSTQGSTSSHSSLASSQNPSSDHGQFTSSQSLSSLSHPRPSVSRKAETLGSLEVSSSESPVTVPGDAPGRLSPTKEISGLSYEQVSGLGTPCEMDGSSHSSSDIQLDDQSVYEGRLRSAQSKGKNSGSWSQQNSGCGNGCGNAVHAGGRKGQIVNGNHLLNFHYDPISRPQPKAPPPRRVQKRKPYNKDLFLQANYKFVMLDTGSYEPDSMDPDNMLKWEDIICLRYSTPFSLQCPICLEYPFCPQITSCGHIFCFPCILQYLMMGKEDPKRECRKRCPLCFVMISLKDLYTVFIEKVKQNSVGDAVEFMLLTRPKDSYGITQRNKPGADGMTGDKHFHDFFSKFTFTSDVDLSVRQAISDLDGWLARAESGLVDDLGKLPYVCAAMEQLEQRKNYWNDLRASSGAKPCNRADLESESHKTSDTSLLTGDGSSAYCETGGLTIGAHILDVFDKNKMHNKSTPEKFEMGTCSVQMANVVGKLETQESSCDESKIFGEPTSSSSSSKHNESYNFYQAIDGQHIILHPLNMRCLLHHYGSYHALPDRISGRILQLDTVTQSAAMRRRYRYLSHFSLTTTFQLCEIDLSGILPPDALSPFRDEIKRRENQRKNLAKKEKNEKMKAEAAYEYAMPLPCSFESCSPDDEPAFSIDDFKVLGSPAPVSSSPPVMERKLFSNVTRLGFAAGYDSPAMKIEDPHSSFTPAPRNMGPGATSGDIGSRDVNTPSFANVVSREKSAKSPDVLKGNEIGKRGKKPSRVLLSTSGGRRY